MFLDLYPEKDRERPFSINEAIDTFSDMDLKMSKKEKYLDKLLSSKNFYGYIFICKDDIMGLGNGLYRFTRQFSGLELGDGSNILFVNGRFLP